MQIRNGPVVPFARRLKPGEKPYTMKAADSVGEIYIYDTIGDSWDGTTAKMFAADLKELGAIKTINVYINSPGGSVFDGTAIYNQLRRHKATKVVHVDGVAASIASVVAMAGDTIKIAANGMMMIHDPWAVAMGSAADLRKMADSLDKVRDAILGTYCERTGCPEDRVNGMMAEETWMTAEECVEMGFADEIIEAVEMAAMSKHAAALANFRHPPEQIAAMASEGDEPAEPAKPNSVDLTTESPASIARRAALARAAASLRKRGLAAKPKAAAAE